MNHSTLCGAAGRWLSGSCQCSVVLVERTTAAQETPDAIGWLRTVSILVECKTSRSDFLSDAKKAFRRDPEKGMGAYRVYLTPEGLLKPADIPKGWSLYEYVKHGRRWQVKYMHGPNICRDWQVEPPFKPHLKTEMRLLLSSIRRIKLSGMCLVAEWPLAETVESADVEGGAE